MVNVTLLQIYTNLFFYPGRESYLYVNQSNLSHMKTIKVRFNLGAGKNFMKWKIERPNGEISYHSPEEVRLVMTGCVLKNQRTTALKIFEGANKTVCSWILCDDVEIVDHVCLTNMNDSERVSYNPRVTPNWMFRGSVADGMRFGKLVSLGNKVYSK